MVFGVGQLNYASHIWLRQTLVAMATKICDFRHKIDYNLAWAGNTSRILSRSKGFSGSANLMVSVKLDNWCLRRILNIHWSEFVTNDEIRSRTGQPFLSDTVGSRRLSFIGHLYRADPGEDHHRAVQACIAGPPDNWRRRIGRPRGNPGSEPWRPTCNL